MASANGYLTVIQGEERSLPLKVQEKDGSSFSLSGVTEINARFNNEDNSVLVKSLSDGDVSVVDAAAGRYQVDLAAAETTALKAGIKQGFTVEFIFGSLPRKANYKKALTVEAPEA